MKNSKDWLIIFSYEANVDKSKLPDHKALSRFISLNTLDSLKGKKIINNFKDCLGKYKDISEESIIVTFNYQNLDKVLREIELLTFKWLSQESFLLIDNERNCKILYKGSKELSLGKFKEVPKEIALNSGAYTYFNDKYYLAS